MTNEILTIALDGHAGLFSLSPDQRHLLTQEYRADGTALLLYRLDDSSAELVWRRNVSDRMRPAHPLWANNSRVILQLLPDGGLMSVNTDRWSDAAGVWGLDVDSGELDQLLPTAATPGLITDGRWLLLREYDVEGGHGWATAAPSNRGIWIDLTTRLTTRLTIPPGATVIGWPEPLQSAAMTS